MTINTCEKNVYSDKYTKVIITILFSGIFLSGFFTGFSFDFVFFKLNFQRFTLIIAFILTIFAWKRKAITFNVFRTNKLMFAIFFVFIGIVFLNSGINFIRMSNKVEILKAIFKLGIVYVTILMLILNISSKNNFIFAIKNIKYFAITIVVFSYIEMITGIRIREGRYIIPNENEGMFHICRTYFENQNDLSTIIILIYIICLFDMLYSNSKKTYVGNLLYLFFSLGILVMTDSTISRITIYLILLGVAISLFIGNYNKKFIIKSIPAIITTIAMFNFLAKGFRYIILKLNMIMTHMMYGSVGSGKIDESLLNGDNLISQLNCNGMGTFKMRTNLFLNSIELSKQHPILGFGPREFVDTMKLHKKELRPTGGMLSPHNLYAELIVEFGYIALTVFVVLIGVIFIHLLIKTIKKDKMALIGMILMGSFIMTTVLPSSFMYAYFYWIAFALAFSSLIIIKGDENSNEDMSRS